MNKHLIVSLVVVVLIITTIVAIKLLSRTEDNWLCQNGQWVKQGNPSEPMPTAVCATGNSSSSTNTNDFSNYWICNNGEWVKYGNPNTPMPTSICTTSNNMQPNIFITLPAQNGEVGKIFKIEGQARVFENTLSVRVLDAQGNKILEKSIMSQAPDAGQYGSFSFEVDLKNFPEVKSGDLFIEAFQYSAKDGAETDKTKIKVKYQPTAEEMIKLKVFFNKSDSADSCEKVYPAEREVVRTLAVARAAVEELLKGPNEQETANGFVTSLNINISLKNITIENGIAKVDFDENLDKNIGGSCRVSAIRAQITQTLKQFPAVREVIISMNGRTEDILQP